MLVRINELHEVRIGVVADVVEQRGNPHLSSVVTIEMAFTNKKINYPTHNAEHTQRMCKP